jgi:hypothetical protein
MAGVGGGQTTPLATGWFGYLDLVEYLSRISIPFVDYLFMQYWQGPSVSWDLAVRYPFIRKGLAIMEKSIGRPHIEKNSGVLAVDLAGKPTAHYYDHGLSKVTSGIKIGDYLYCGSIVSPYITRLNLKKHPARATT